MGVKEEFEFYANSMVKAMRLLCLLIDHKALTLPGGYIFIGSLYWYNSEAKRALLCPRRLFILEVSGVFVCCLDLRGQQKNTSEMS